MKDHFISDGAWFDKGTPAQLVYGTGTIWRRGDEWVGLFVGMRYGKPDTGVFPLDDGLGVAPSGWPQ